MKFNEKLIELRKKQGLSQEELGYKLNVTRQTISKWELGQTTPEMDKLVDISKIFNISVDELINESEVANNQKTVIEDQPIEEKKETKNNKIIIVIVGVLIVVVALIIIKGLTWITMTNKLLNGSNDVQENIFERFFDIFDKINDSIDKGEGTEQENIFERSLGIFDKINDSMNKEERTEQDKENKKKLDIANFNSSMELFNGTNQGLSVQKLLDSINTNNKTQDRKIIVKYKEIETQDESKIKNIKTEIKELNRYEISFEYDEEGYINKAIIENLESQSDTSDMMVELKGMMEQQMNDMKLPF